MEKFIVVMGVSGCGKTTIGRALANDLGWPFYDGDDYHPSENVEKMRGGIPLNDEDRAGWLETLANIIRDSLGKGQSGVLACSSLKQKYRDQLAVGPEVKFVYLKGEYELIKTRMEYRSGHYMKPGMLDSQFATLEEPVETEALTVDASKNPEQILDLTKKEFNLSLYEKGVHGEIFESCKGIDF